jgi:hypothetical protein
VIAIGQEPELPGHAFLHLVDLQVGEAFLDRAQDLRHGVVAGVDDAHPKCGAGGPACRAAATARSAEPRICRASVRNAVPAGFSAT